MRDRLEQRVSELKAEQHRDCRRNSGERAQAGSWALPDSRSLAAAPRRPGNARPGAAGSALLRLQRDYGNRYVQGVISRAQSGEAGLPSGNSYPPSAVADAAAGAVDASLQRAIDRSRRGGHSLDQKTATELGGALGRDVSHVRVHDDDQADRLSQSLNAAAFTIGSDIFFRARHYNPGTAPGRRLLAHELVHVAQQEVGPRTAHRYHLAPADHPGERVADRAADDMLLRGRAQPVTTSPRGPLIQRKAFIGWDPLSARRAEFGGSLREKTERKQAPRRAGPVAEVRGRARERGEDAEGARGRARQQAEDLPQVKRKRFVKVPYELADLGVGERQLARILVDYKSRYFRNLNELYRYARRETDDIGFVDREKGWVRLPEEFLVIGESHNRTTVMDLVEATGVEKYIYEGGATRPSPYFETGKTSPEMEHQLEELLPKYIVGLIGVQHKLEQELRGLDLRPGWKSEIRGERQIAERADPEAERRQYQTEMAEWSYAWEAKYRTREERGEWKIGPSGGYVGQRRPAGGLSSPAPSRPYSRSGTEVRATLQGLRVIRDLARGKKDPIALFYAQHRSIIDKTIAQLEAGLPIELTRMFLKMATGKFDLKVLIKLLSSAATQEFADLKLSNVKVHVSYTAGKFSGPVETGAEELRDSYMLHRIIDAKAKGYRLAGLGDAHRSRLQGVLQAMDPDILVQSSDDFYVDQYRSHPDRD
jgi:hypothetical protein